VLPPRRSRHLLRQRSIKRANRRDDYPNESRIIIAIGSRIPRIGLSVIGSPIARVQSKGEREASIRHVRTLRVSHARGCGAPRKCAPNASKLSGTFADFFSAAAVSPGCLAIRRKAPRQMRLRGPSYGRESVIGLRKTAHVPSRDVPAWLASDARW